MEVSAQAAVIGQLDLAKKKLVQGDEPGFLAALDHAIALEPYCFPAYLMKGKYFQDKGQRRVAADLYKKALKIVPPEDELAPSLQQAVRKAQAVVEADADELQTFLRQRISDARGRHPLARLERFDHCLDVFAGKSKVFLNEASLLLFPQLPAIPFLDNADFPWLDRLSAETAEMVGEAKHALQANREEFRPYVDAPPGAPLNQWAKLNRSRDWSTFYFWRDGVRQDQNCVACPRTAAACEGSPLAFVPEHAPTAMYSCLAAGARIPPHTGVTNTRLVLHLPLIVPTGCGYRVGHVTREWRVGVPWIFDDTIEHEAWNDSREPRLLLIFDIWHPLLSNAEREMVCALLTASRDYLRSA